MSPLCDVFSGPVEDHSRRHWYWVVVQGGSKSMQELCATVHGRYETYCIFCINIWPKLCRKMSASMLRFIALQIYFKTCLYRPLSSKDVFDILTKINDTFLVYPSNFQVWWCQHNTFLTKISSTLPSKLTLDYTNK